MIKKAAQIFLILIILLFIIMQFFQPHKNDQKITNSHIYSQATMSDDMKVLLKNACLDCHSNTTTYDWYHKISPVSWYVNMHVVEGKKEVNFSEWEGLSKLEKIGLLDAISEEVEEGKMPLKSYTLIHRNARLSAADKKAITSWATNYAEELLTEK